MLAALERGKFGSSAGLATSQRMAREEGEAGMARYELAEAEAASLGQAHASGDALFELGIKYSTGRSVPADFVSAHKWFNLAAMRGKSEAIHYRREVAAEMSEAQIAAAQRAARDWLARH
jgi:TPR repeat protein